MNRLNLRTKILLSLSMAMGIFILPSFAQAGIIGGSLKATGGDVSITFKGSDAGYTSTLSFEGRVLFSNRATAGMTVNLGNFAAGTELNFQLLVHDTGNTFSTGMGAMNPDGIAHTLVTDLGNGTTQVGWEDLLGGGDRDYNDLLFELTTTGEYSGEGENPGQGKLIANPEPSTMILFGSGLLGLGAWRLRKKQS